VRYVALGTGSPRAGAPERLDSGSRITADYANVLARYYIETP